MLLQVFSVRDSKAEVFNTPWFAKNRGEAERIFTGLVRKEETMVSQFPEDYDLYHLGTYCDQKGTVESFDTPVHIAKAIQIKEQKAP